MNKQEIEKAIRYLNAAQFVGHDFSAAISALTQQLNNGWIPVTERMPNNEESIKNRADFIITDTEKNVYPVTFNCAKQKWQDDDGYIFKGVIAWRLLPEPYKEVHS